MEKDFGIFDTSLALKVVSSSNEEVGITLDREQLWNSWKMRIFHNGLFIDEDVNEYIREECDDLWKSVCKVKNTEEGFVISGMSAKHFFYSSLISKNMKA